MLRRFAIDAGHVLYRPARNGRSKPVEEPNAVGLTRIEAIQHMRTAAVVQRILRQHSVKISANDAFITLSRDVLAVLRPHVSRLDVGSLERTFTIRANEGFVAGLSASLVAAINAAAPRVRLRFAPKPEKDARALREGQIDLEIGVLGTFAPEVRTQALFRDSFVGVARIGHPVLAGTNVTLERYAACDHVVASRRGEFTGPVDDALEKLGLRRKVVVVVPGFPDAMRIARHSDLVALVPRSCFGNGLECDQAATAGLQSFVLPVRTPEIVISAMWHPRMDADPAHRWFRDTVIAVCRTANQRR